MENCRLNVIGSNSFNGTLHDIALDVRMGVVAMGCGFAVTAA
jgi:hypothetical protein